MGDVHSRHALAAPWGARRRERWRGRAGCLPGAACLTVPRCHDRRTFCIKRKIKFKVILLLEKTKQKEKNRVFRTSARERSPLRHLEGAPLLGKSHFSSARWWSASHMPLFLKPGQRQQRPFCPHHTPGAAEQRSDLRRVKGGPLLRDLRCVSCPVGGAPWFTKTF